MIRPKAHVIIPIIISGFFLLIDQLLKFLARTNSTNTGYIWKPWLGWEYFENIGIAFGLPLPQIITLIVSPIIILGIIIWWIKKIQETFLFYLGNALIIGGALSNLIDRILFSITIDYFRFFTSVINIADIMIVTGVVLLASNEINKKSKHHSPK